MTRNYAAPPNRPPRDPQPRDDGMHRTPNMTTAFARMSLGGGDPHHPRDPPTGGRMVAWDPNPRDPPNGFIVVGADPNPRDPGSARLFAMGPQPRDDGKSRTRRFARGPQPRDPGN